MDSNTAPTLDMAESMGGAASVLVTSKEKKQGAPEVTASDTDEKQEETVIILPGASVNRPGMVKRAPHIPDTLFVTVNSMNAVDRLGGIAVKQLCTGNHITVLCPRDASSPNIVIKFSNNRRGICQVLWEATVLHMLPPHPNIIQPRTWTGDKVAPHQHTFAFVSRAFLCIGMAMERGEMDLVDYIQRQKQHFTDAQVAHMILQVIDGAMHMHAHHLCHGDIKVGNIVVTSLGSGEKEWPCLKLIDFDKTYAPTESGHVPVSRIDELGTPCYVPPELAYVYSSHARLADRATVRAEPMDAWCVGIVLYILLEQRPPWESSKTVPTGIHSVVYRHFAKQMELRQQGHAIPNPFYTFPDSPDTFLDRHATLQAVTLGLLTTTPHKRMTLATARHLLQKHMGM